MERLYRLFGRKNLTCWGILAICAVDIWKRGMTAPTALLVFGIFLVYVAGVSGEKFLPVLSAIKGAKSNG